MIQLRSYVQHVYLERAFLTRSYFYLNIMEGSHSNEVYEERFRSSLKANGAVTNPDSISAVPFRFPIYVRASEVSNIDLRKSWIVTRYFEL